MRSLRAGRGSGIASVAWPEDDRTRNASGRACRSYGHRRREAARRSGRARRAPVPSDTRGMRSRGSAPGARGPSRAPASDARRASRSSRSIPCPDRAGVRSSSHRGRPPIRAPVFWSGHRYVRGGRSTVENVRPVGPRRALSSPTRATRRRRRRPQSRAPRDRRRQCRRARRPRRPRAGSARGAN